MEEAVVVAVPLAVACAEASQSQTQTYAIAATPAALPERIGNTTGCALWPTGNSQPTDRRVIVSLDVDAAARPTLVYTCVFL